MLKIDLTGVPQTLLLPLMARAWFNELNISQFKDLTASKVACSIDYDFKNLANNYGLFRCFGFLGRAYQCDCFIQAQLEKYPDTVVVDLGCGLETSFYRVDNGKLTWVDIDLPEVISIKQALLPPKDRLHYISQSIFDYSWIDKVKTLGSHFIFISAGVLIYFDNDTVKNLLNTLSQKFPESSIMFDFVSERRRKIANISLAKINMQNAKITWSINRRQELIELLPKNAKLKIINYFSGMMRFLNISLYQKLKLLLFFKFYNSGIAIVKF